MDPKKSKQLQQIFENIMNGKWHPDIEWYYSEDIQRALEEVYNLGVADATENMIFKNNSGREPYHAWLHSGQSN